MPDQQKVASQKQMQFLWNLVQGGHEMQLTQYMPAEFQTEAQATQTFQAGMTSAQASTWIEDLIYRVGAVPPGSRTDQAGQPKIASNKQVNLYNAIAQEIAELGDPQWTQHQMLGRYSWTVSKWINRLQDAKENLSRLSQPQQQWGQPQQQPQQPWGQPQQAAPAQAFQPVPAAQPTPPYFDSNGNPIPQGNAGNAPF